MPSWFIKVRKYNKVWTEALERARADKDRLFRMAMPSEQVVEASVHAPTSNRPKMRHLGSLERQKHRLSEMAAPRSRLRSPGQDVVS